MSFVIVKHQIPSRARAIRHSVICSLIVLLCASVLSALVLALPLNAYPEYSNAKKFSTIDMCLGTIADCQTNDAEFQDVSLPVYLPPVRKKGTHVATFQFEFDRSDIDSDVAAVFLPRFADGLRVELNGDPISPNTDNFERYKDKPFTRLWHLPFYTTFTKRSLKESGNTVFIELEAYNFTQITLSPVYIGDAFRLRIANQFRFIARNGYIRVAFALQIGIGGFLLLLWLARSRDTEYGWALAANLAACLTCWHYILPNTPFSAHAWTLIWNIAIQVYIYALYRYSRKIIKLPYSRVTIWWVTVFCLLSSLTLCLIPVEQLAVSLTYYHIGNGLLALSIPYLFLINLRSNPYINIAHFVIFIVAFSFLVRDFLYIYFAPDRVIFQMGQFVPLLVFTIITSLLITRLAISLNRAETLQQTMKQTIEDKSAEIVAKENQLAVTRERHRIMLDLHDGVGGQLVNTLAYMRGRKNSDPIVKSSMEAALRDMALIIDSLEGYEDISTLLGSLRSRIEPLLDENHIQLLWHLDGAPNIETNQRSNNLSIIRIIQEAITNAVKHGRAETITVSSDDKSITIIDDGQGFDLQKARQKTGTNSGMGLEGMQHRAREIGIDCLIDSSPSGTQVQLIWPNQ